MTQFSLDEMLKSSWNIHTKFSRYYSFGEVEFRLDGFIGSHWVDNNHINRTDSKAKRLTISYVSAEDRCFYIMWDDEDTDCV